MIDQAKYPDLADIPPDAFKNALQLWRQPNCVMRRLLTAMAAEEAKKAHNSLRHCPIDEVMKVRGQIEGIEITANKISDPDPK